MSIVVGSATFARGFSGFDHLIDDSALNGMVGKSFRSFKAAAKAAHKMAKETQHRCIHSTTPIIILDADGNGSRYWNDGTTA